MRECIEFNWDERTEVAEFIYEDDRTGELTTERVYKPHPHPDKSVDRLREEYFANLRFWLLTQPLYD